MDYNRENFIFVQTSHKISNHWERILKTIKKPISTRSNKSQIKNHAKNRQITPFHSIQRDQNHHANFQKPARQLEKLKKPACKKKQQNEARRKTT